MRARGVICQALSVFICLVSASSRLQAETRTNILTVASDQASSTRSTSATRNQPFSIADLPLQFEENVGQADSRARFLARGRGYTLLLNRDGVALNLAGPHGATTEGVYMRLLGARAGEISGREQTATLTNYYIGSDPLSWHQNVRSYRSVAYASVYQGIDLIYHGNGNQLEYDFVVAPGADPDQVRMRFDGLNPRLDDKDISFGKENHISIRALKAFQTIGGDVKSVDAAWQVQGDQASIQLGAYDHSQPLTIDPVFFYGSYVGGSANDSAVSIVPAKQAGYYFVALSTNSAIIEEPGQAPNNPKCAKGCPVDTLILGINATDAPAPATPFPPYSHAAAPLPALAINSATYIGGTTGSTIPTAMAGDSNSNLYVTGTTDQGGSFTSLGPQVCSTTCTGFASKLSTSINTTAGSAALTLQYSFGLPVLPTAIAADSTGDVYLTGSASASPTSVNLSVPPGDVSFQKLTALGTALTSGTHAFLLGLAPTGIPFFASYIGGSGTDQGNAVTVSGQTVFIAGQTSSADFPSTVGNKFGGTQDAFVLAAQNLATMPALLYSTYLGGAGTNLAASIAAGTSGTVVVAGSTNSSAFPIQSDPQFLAQTWPLGTGSDGNGGQFDTPPTTPPTTVSLPTAVPEGSQDAFVTSLAADGSLTFTDFLGGAGDETTTSAQAVALDSLGVVYVTGSSTATGPNQPFLSGTATEDLRVEQSDGLSNAFFAQIDPSGKYLLEATLAGSSGTDTAAGLTVSSPLASSGIVSIVGSTTPIATEGSATSDFFQSASLSLLNPNSPTAPTKDLSTDATGFFVEEALAGYCSMQLTKQVGKVLSFSGPCVSGTQSGTLFASATAPGSENVNTLTPVPITVAASGGVLTGTATLNLGSLTGAQSLNLSFGFLPEGAIGGTGTCQLTGPNGSGTGVSGCGIVTTGGGGGGTIFSVTSGTLLVTLTCPLNCNNLGFPNTVLTGGQPAILNASVTSGSPNAVTWTPVNGPTGQLTNLTTTTANFVAGTRGGTTKITATATADGTTPGTITLTTLESPTINAVVSNAGTPVYGQAVSIAVSSSGNSATPSGAFTYHVDDGNVVAGTLSASGAATISLTGLSAGSHSITVAYPGNYLSGGFLTPVSTTLNFTVNQAPLTVQANNLNVQYSKPIPTLTYTITGFQYTDTAASLGGAPALATKATASSPIGQYLITITQGTFGQDSAIAANYSFTFVGGTLSIVSLGAAPTPVISPAAGAYTTPQAITISDSVTGAKIYYTLDGSVPTASSTLYTGPFTLSALATVQAIATATGYGNSGLGSATYTISAPALSAATVSFGGIIEGLTSTAQAITLTNQGLNPLTNIAISIGGANAGDFTLNSTSTCGSTLATGASCSISILFTPAAVGSRNAALSVSYTGIGSPLSATLQGTGLSPLSITSTVAQLTAGSTYQFTANQPVTWTASAGTIDSTGLFTAPNPPPSPDVVTITAISIANSQLVSTIQVSIALVPTITLPTTNTLSPGQSITIPFSLAPGTGILGDSYVLACTPATLPTNVTCVFNPNPIVDSAGSNSGTLTITSNALNSKLLEQRRPGSSLPLGGSALTVACCFLFGIRRRLKGRQWMLGLVMLVSGALLSMSACGTGGTFKTGSSTAYVTGSFAIQATVKGATAGAPDYNQTVSIFTVNLTIQ